jgi:hypothetical protein
MALLGKISAVVTANTTDFTRKIGDVKSELEGLKRRADGYRLNLDTNALDKTLTKLQLFRRTLQEAFGKKIDTGPLQDLYKAYEDLGKPLTKVKNQIESLAYSTQAFLYPALEQVQRGFQNLYREIQAGTTTFDASKGRIESLTRALERLKASAAVVSEFSRLTGSLSVESAGADFVQPKALAELRKFIELRKEAAKLPAAAREDPFFQGIIRDSSVAAERIEALTAKIERAKLRAAKAEEIIARASARGVPAPAPALAVASSAAADQLKAQTQLDSELERQGRRNASLAARTSLADLAALRNRPSPDEITPDSATAKAAAAIAAIRAVERPQRFENLVSGLLNAAEAAEKVTDDTRALKTALDAVVGQADSLNRLAASINTLGDFNRRAGSRVEALRTDADRRRQAIEEARQSGVPKSDIRAMRQQDFIGGLAGRAGSVRDDIAGLSSALGGDLQSRSDRLNTSLQKLFAAKGNALPSDINKVRVALSGLEEDAKKANAQQRLLNDFDASTATNTQPRAVKDYISDYQLLINLAGRLNEETGTRFAASLDQSRKRVRGIAEEIAAIKLGPPTEQSARRVQQLLDLIRRESTQLAKELSTLGPQLGNQKQIEAILSRNRRLNGDIDGFRNAAMKGQLALQQLTFAVDDFFSATGGFEYKLRAISNNISQFGFVLGGTAGLIAGVAATVGTQLLVQFSGIGRASKEAEGGLKFLNDELSKSRNLAEQNTKAFQDLAKAISGATTTGPRQAIQERLNQLREEQKQIRESDIKSRDPRVIEAAGRRKALEDKLEATSNPGERVRIRAELEDARRKERAAAEESLRPIPFDRLVSDRLRPLIESSRELEINSLRSRPRNERENRRLEELSRDRFSPPADPRAAADQIRARLTELNETQRNSQLFVPTLASILPDSFEQALSKVSLDGSISQVDAFSRTERVIAELDAELARLDSVIKEGADNIAAEFFDRGEAAKQDIQNAFKDLANLRLDADIQGRLEEQFKAPAAALATAIADIEKRLTEDPTANIDDLRRSADAASAALEALYRNADTVARNVALGSVVSTASRLSTAAEIAGQVQGPTAAGTNIARAIADLQELQSRRSRAEAAGNTAAVADIDKEIAKIRDTAAAMGEAAIAVAAFQQAVERAALGLQRTLVGEAASDADRLRRRANRLAGDPLMAGAAAASRDAAERRLRDEEDSQRQLEADLARARLAFEAESDPRRSRLARDVREGRLEQNNKAATAGEQLAGKAKADRAQAELDRSFESRADVQAARRRADARDTKRQAEIERVRLANERPLQDLESSRGILGDNARMAGGLGAGAVQAAGDLQKKLEEARRRVDDAVSAGDEIPDVLKKSLESLARQIEDQRLEFVAGTVKRAKAAGSGFVAQGDAARGELERAGVFASAVQGRLTELEVQRQSLQQKRDSLSGVGDSAGAAKAQAEIDAMETMTQELNAAAIAVAAFQEAANKAALNLQKTVESESQSAAESARRRANEAEAVFGAGSPQAKEARDQQARREKAARKAEDERARADEAIAKERVKFEQEMAAGANPAAAARAEKIRQLEETANNKNESETTREAARAEAARLRREQQREFENRPDVQRERKRADAADAERAKMDSADRGRELMKTQRQRDMERLAADAGDIGNAVKEMRDAGVNRRVINKSVQDAANNMALGSAPMLAGFAEEVMSARLGGPSRAALSVTDAGTAEGAKELNRLLRGDDPAKDVNLVEMRKQSSLLEAIEKAILASTGVVVEL